MLWFCALYAYWYSKSALDALLFEKYTRYGWKRADFGLLQNAVWSCSSLHVSTNPCSVTSCSLCLALGCVNLSHLQLSTYAQCSQTTCHVRFQSACCRIWKFWRFQRFFLQTVKGPILARIFHTCLLVPWSSLLERGIRSQKLGYSQTSSANFIWGFLRKPAVLASSREYFIRSLGFEQ